VNANPSGSRTPPAGSRGRAKARRVTATVAGPSPGQLRRVAVAGIVGTYYGFALDSMGGTRHAMMVCRGALTVRRAAQGRVGDLDIPRHIVCHLAILRLLSANPSARPDAVRPRFPARGVRRPVEKPAVRKLALRVASPPGKRSSPRFEARDNEPVHARSVVVVTSAFGQHRGKGVRAA
jgi:hypothetical protein